MSHRIRCYTLFDITQTGVANRSKPQNNDDGTWLRRRNTQCNFDTILQVISLRSQPEVVKIPAMVDIDDYSYFGRDLKDSVTKCWRFEFDVQHSSVFQDGKDPLGALYTDCDRVPMILLQEQSQLVTSTLNTTPELKNIHFEIV